MAKLVTIFSVVSLLLLVVACRAHKAPVVTSPGVATVAPDGKSQIVFLEYKKRATYAQPVDYFKVELMNNGKVKIHRQRGMQEEDLTTDASLMDELLKVYKEGKVADWKSNYQPPLEVLDGYSWNLEVKFGNGSYKYSHGNNANPDTNALEEFSKLIWNLKK